MNSSNRAEWLRHLAPGMRVVFYPSLYWGRPSIVEVSGHLTDTDALILTNGLQVSLLTGHVMRHGREYPPWIEPCTPEMAARIKAFEVDK